MIMDYVAHNRIRLWAIESYFFFKLLISSLSYFKMLLNNIENIYLVGIILTNCHTILYDSQTSLFFNVPPALEEYLYLSFFVSVYFLCSRKITHYGKTRTREYIHIFQIAIRVMNNYKNLKYFLMKSNIKCCTLARPVVYSPLLKLQNVNSIGIK